MYGTVARMQIQPGQEAAMKALAASRPGERRPEAQGFIAEYILQSERVSGEWFALALFESEESYRQNAADPAQHRQYEAIRALLTTDPEWNDGPVISLEPSSVPV